ncbi:MAG: hypothetical protein Q9205_006401 [Flavoplaca limonia]
MAGEVSKGRQKGYPKAWLPQAGGHSTGFGTWAICRSLRDRLYVRILTESLPCLGYVGYLWEQIRPALTIDLDATKKAFEACLDAGATLNYWQRDVEGLFSLINDRIASFLAQSSTETENLEHPSSSLDVGAPNFVREVEQLTKKADGWYEDLNHLEITLYTNHCQQLRLQHGQQEPYEIAWWQPEQLRQVQERRDFDLSRRDSETDEDSRES